MKVVAVIELDDKSHNTKKGMNRDALVNEAKVVPFVKTKNIFF